MAELPYNEKNDISHRGRALREFTLLLNARMSMEGKEVCEPV